MDTLEKSFESATETSKLLITLATGVIAFCVTLVNYEQGKVLTLTPTTYFQKVFFSASWIVLALCAGFGIWTQLAITHVLSQDDPNVWSMTIRFPYMLQLTSFVLGMMVLVGYCIWKVFER